MKKIKIFGALQIGIIAQVYGPENLLENVVFHNKT